MNKYYLNIVLGFLFAIHVGYSQDEVPYSDTDIASFISSGNFFAVVDQTIGSADTMISTTGFVALKVISGQPPYTWYRYSVTLEVTPILEDGTAGTSYPIELTVVQNLISGAGQSIDIAKHAITADFGANVVIKNGTYEDLSQSNGAVDTNGYIPENIVIELSYDSEQYTQLSLDPVIVRGVRDEDHNELTLTWDAVAGALSYDVEWTWIDNYAGGIDDDINTIKAADNIKFSPRDFQLNSTRIQINSKTTYNVPLIYDRGYIIYRVRGVGKYVNSPHKYEFGAWSSGTNGETYISDWGEEDSGYYELTSEFQHQKDKNWQFQSSFAEEGKKKEVVSYFDGTLRNRQTVTKINSDDNVIVGEVIYDAQGRPAIEALPVPTDKKSIEYVNNFTRNATGDVYDYTDFDENSQNIFDEFPIDNKKMSTVDGASRYYSSNSLDNQFKDRLPDAGGYPFSQTEYMPDNTGRVRRKSGVGATHQLGSGQEMEYYYGFPEQKELNRLFGYSVGVGNHYKKNMVIDPNGQGSVTYTDPQGRTIATALSGYKTPNLDGLTNEDDTTVDATGNLMHGSLKTDLLGKLALNAIDTQEDSNIKTSTQRYGAQEDALEYGGAKLSVFDEKRTFNYSVTNDPYFIYSCNTDNSVQYPLTYDLAIDVLNIDGFSILEEGPVSNYIAFKADENRFEKNDFKADVKRGSFSIAKSLQVNKNDLESYADDYLERLQNPEDACYISPEEVTDIPELTLDGCFMNCDECELALTTNYPSSTDYADAQLEAYDFSELEYLSAQELVLEKTNLRVVFSAQWDALLSACRAPCSDGTIEVDTTIDEVVANSISCQIGKSQLLNDLKPIGQYGALIAKVYETENDNNEDVAPNRAELNIYNIGNKLFSTKTSNNSSEGHNSWRNPRHFDRDQLSNDTSGLYEAGHYYNDDGTISYITVQRTAVIPEDTSEDDTQVIEYTYEPKLYNPNDLEIEDLGILIPVSSDTTENQNTFYVEPQFIEDVNYILSEEVWQQQWTESVLVYHPEYCYLEYNEAVCGIVFENRNSDGFDRYINAFSTFKMAETGGVFNNISHTTLRQLDPYFSGNSNPVFDNKSLRVEIIDELLTENYNGSGMNIMEFSYATVKCNSITTCDLQQYLGTSTPSANTIITNVGRFPDEADQDKFWNMYKANYATAKQTIQSLFANIYAQRNNCYNGCIGPDVPTSTLLTVISDMSTSVQDKVETLIGGASSSSGICSDPNVRLYQTKEKRYKPSDNQYNSGDSAENIQNYLQELTNYEYYVASGICPLGRDLEMYLNYSFREHLNGLPATQEYKKQYLTIPLYQELGGEHPTNTPFSINHTYSSTTNNNKTLAIQLSKNGVVLDNASLEIILPTGYTNNWSTYRDNNWIISEVKSMKAAYNDVTELFDFNAIARVKKNLEDEEYEEIIISGTTSARISECSITTTETEGEYLGNGGLNTDASCNKKVRFKNAFARLLDQLVKTNRITSADLSTIPAYTDSYLSEFFGGTNATWQQEGQGIYKIVLADGTSSNTVLQLELEENLVAEDIISIASVYLSYLENTDGGIVSENITISYRDSRRPRRYKYMNGSLYKSCTSNNGDGKEGKEGKVEEGEGESTVGSSTCELINFLCCGDINDLVVEETYECAELVIACPEYVDTEAAFEEGFRIVMDEVFKNVLISFDPTAFNTPEVIEFKNNLKLQQRFQKLIDANASQAFNVATAHVEARLAYGDGASFELSFYRSASENAYNSPLARFFVSFDRAENDFASQGEDRVFSGINEILCLDLISEENQGLQITYKTVDGSINTFETKLSLSLRNGSENIYYTEPNLPCEFFEEPEEEVECSSLEKGREFANDYRVLFNKLIKDGALEGDYRIAKPIPLKNYTEYNSLIQNYLSNESVNSYEVYSNLVAFPDIGTKGLNFSDLDHIYATLSFTNSRLKLKIHYSDIYVIEFDIYIESGIKPNSSFELKEIELDINLNTASNRIENISSTYTQDGETFVTDRVSNTNFSGSIMVKTDTGLFADGGYQLFDFKCENFIPPNISLLQDSIENLYNEDINICELSTNNENVFEDLLRDIINENYLSKRENRSFNNSYLDQLFLNDFNLNERMRLAILDNTTEWLPVNQEKFWLYRIRENDTDRVLPSGSFNYTEFGHGYLDFEVAFKEVFGTTLLRISKEEDFNDIFEVLDIKIVKAAKSDVGTIISNAGRTKPYFATIDYINNQGQNKRAKNIRISLQRKNSSYTKAASPTLCRLLSYSVAPDFNVTRSSVVRLKANDQQFDNFQVQDPFSFKNNFSSGDNTTLSDSGIVQEEVLCGADICIPPIPTPISCTDKYNDSSNGYLAVMNSIADIVAAEDIMSQKDFCEASLQYVVDDYAYYIDKFDIKSTLDINYISMARFSATEFNFGYPGMSEVYESRPPIIDMFFTHVDNASEDELLTWAAFTSKYLDLEDNQSICVPRPFPADFSDIYVDMPEEDCVQFSKNIRAAYVRETYQSFLDTKREEFVKAYIKKAIDGAVENFDMEYFDKEYQYTLYYYDQSGNLSQTVPPEGVDRFGDIELEALVGGVSLTDRIDQHRADNVATENIALLPDHKLKTEYRYNSLNQLVWQKTPDAGISRFAYDDLGRIIATQNAKQLANNRFSYTTYDGLGRISEAGELAPDMPIQIEDTKGKLVYTATNTPVEFEKTIPNPNAGLEGQPATIKSRYPSHIATNRYEVTTTRYNDLRSSPIQIFDTVNDQEIYTSNTRNRVAAIFYYDQYVEGDTNEQQYDNAIYYTYDIHGNVEELVQHNTQMALTKDDPTSGMKRTRYEYDLISGNVNSVVYQSGKKDQYIHKYTYDADNRIINVQTSGDGMIWEQDASYQYFAHGPLARTELGAQKVQGIDYAYTLQGWLKGVNSENLNPNADMGQDGTTASNVAKDAMGYSLSYFTDDYKSVTTTANDPNNPFNNYNASSGNNLYNGNIKQMVTDLLDNDESMLGVQRNVYQYDQLNRIKNMQGYNQDNDENYNSSYTYDNNGNLLTLNRDAVNKKGKGGIDMDQLSYTYKTIPDPEDPTIVKRSNQLDHVKDAIRGNGKQYNDLKNQREGNYQYDAIGQLISDRKEKISNIEWRVDGKVRQITKTDGSTISFTYDGLGNRISKTVMPGNKTTLYSRDAQGNTLAVYEADTSGDVAQELRIKEHHIYGSSRLGLEEKDVLLTDETVTNEDIYSNTVGDKRFELSNHLGNVLSVITDRKVIAGSAVPEGPVENVVHLTDFTSSVAPWIKQGGRANLSLDNERLSVAVDRKNQGAKASYLLTTGRTYEVSMDIDVASFTPDLQVRILSNGTALYNQNFSESGVIKTTITATETDLYTINTRLFKQGQYKDGVQTYYLDNIKIVDITDDGDNFGGADTPLYANDFTDSLDPWSKTNQAQGVSIKQGKLRVGTKKHNHGAKSNYALVAGKTYTISMDLDVSSFDPNLEIRISKGNNVLLSEIITDQDSFTTTFTPDESRNYTISARLRDNSYTGKGRPQVFSIDNFEINEVIDTPPVDNKDLVDGDGNLITFAPDVISFNDYYPFGMLLPNRNGNSPAYRYGFNGMEKDDDIKGTGNSYDFGARMYDPRVGRWFSTDPIFQPYESPYSYAANNPIVYIDDEGQDNIIYLVFLPSAFESLTKQEVNNIVSKLNEKLEELGLKTNVKLYSKQEPFDSRNLDLTDTYAVIGSVNDVKTEISKNPENHQDLITANTAKDFKGGLENAENSANMSIRVTDYKIEKRNGSGILVDSDALGVVAEEALSTDKTTAAVYIILHGVSHNAGEEHNVSYALGKDFGKIVNSIDKKIVPFQAGKGSVDTIGDIHDVLSEYENISKFINSDSETYTDIVKRRLKDNKPKDNYEKNKEKNSKTQVGPKRQDGKF